MPTLPDRPLVISVFLGIVVAAVGQQVSPFHLLTHTFTTVATILATLAFAVWATTRRADAIDVVTRGLVAVVGAGLGIHGAMTLANLGWHRCDGTGTAAFFWVTWVPLALGGVAFGTVVRRFRWRVRVLLLLVVVATTLAHDGLQAILGVRILDPLIGDPLFLDQRADLTLPVVHLMSRGWLLLGVVSLLGRSLTSTGAGRTVANVLLASFTLLTVFGGGTTGVGWSRAARNAELDALHETEHFRLRYRADGPVAGRVELIAHEAEYQWTQLTHWLGVDPAARVDVQLFDDDEALWRVTGIRNAHAGYRSMNVRWWDALQSTFPHELVHTLHAELSWNPRILLSTGLIEGTAMAWDYGYGWNREAHVDVAAAHRAGHLPAAGVILSPTGFTTINESNAYRFAGSFIGFLVLEHGMEAFLEFQRSLDPVAAFGHDLDALDAQWRVFLGGIDVPADRQSKARDRFDPAQAPGVFAARCPKLGALDLSPEALARARSDNGDPAGAATIYEQLFEADGRSRWGFAAASAYQRAERPEAALAVLKRLSDDGPDDLRSRAVQARINATLLLAVEQDSESAWNALYALFVQRRELETPSRDRERLERLLHRPIRRAVGEALLLGSGAAVDTILTRLLREHAEDADLLALRATRGTVWPRSRTQRAELTAWERSLGLVEAAGVCPEVRSAETVVARFLDDRRPDLAERWMVVMARACATTLSPHDLQRMQMRVDEGANP